MPAALDQQKTFKEKTTPVFNSIALQFEIHPRIALIQSAHESNWGLSQLSTEGMNIFGMMAGSAWVRYKRGEIPLEEVPNWTSLGRAIITLPGWEHSDFPPEKIRFWNFPGDIREKKPDGKGGSVLTVELAFRKYANWNESAWDWARKIAKADRYRFAYAAAKKGDILEYAAAIQASGYATDKVYGDKLLRIGRIVASLPEKTA